MLWLILTVVQMIVKISQSREATDLRQVLECIVLLSQFNSECKSKIIIKINLQDNKNKKWYIQD